MIFLITDGHRWDCLGHAGHPDVRTPNLDALALHGMRFSQAISQSTDASISRSTLMTGRYPNSIGIANNGNDRNKNPSTLSHILRNQGYNTGCVGHLDLSEKSADNGFDVVIFPQGEEDKPIDKSEELLEVIGTRPSSRENEQHPTTSTGNHLIRFLRFAREPFFLCGSFAKPRHPYFLPQPWNAIHSPEKLTLPDGWCNPVPEHDLKQIQHIDLHQMTEEVFRTILASYYATIGHIDQQIGRILATLAGRGFTNNIIVYCSTSGDYMGQHGLISSFSNLLYDSLLRVPLIIAGMRGQRRGFTNTCLAELTDIVPTVIDILRLDLPQDIKGKSLKSQLKRKDILHRDNALSCGSEDISLLRGVRYKLIESDNEDLKALYDLNTDPHEFANLIREKSAFNICQDMQQNLKRKLAGIGKD